MASFSNYPNNGLTRISLLLLILIFSPTFFSSTSTSVGSSPANLRGSESEEVAVKETEKVLGSRPPQCINRCFNCRPCMAALVTPPHHKTSSRGDETYYLLAWKCKCGDEYFQP